MKAKYLALVIFLGFSSMSHAQFLKKLVKKAEKAAARTLERKVEEKTEEKTTQTFDTIMNSTEKIKIGRKSDDKNEETKKENQGTSTEQGQQDQVITGSTFFPNGNVIFEDYFEQDAVGDFPARWETNSGGEVISIYDGKAMRLYPNGRYIISTNTLPENYAVDFYLITDQLTNAGTSGSSFNIVLSQKNSLNKPRTGASMGFSLWKGAKSVTNKIGVSNWGKVKTNISNTIPFSIDEKLDNIMQITLVVNGPRMRLFIDNEKAVDLPSLLKPSFGRYIQFYLKGTNTKNGHLVALANVVITEESEDIRSKLMQGGFSTTKILFNSGSAELKSESFEFLSQLGATLEKDPSIKIKIIGHTDSDGSKENNLILSQNRAERVAEYLLQNFNISENNIQTEGMGESAPITENKTSEGKAQNRRVEFKTI
jgi:outer membrane protein OmpA-like peptidoglycan-associated protein